MIKLFPTNNKCLTPPRLNSMQVDCQGISNSQTFKCILRVIFLCTRHSQHSGRAAQALKVRFENFECANNIPYARVEKRIQIEFICRTMCDPGRKSVLSIRGGVGVGCGNTKKKVGGKKLYNRRVQLAVLSAPKDYDYFAQRCVLAVITCTS